MRSRRRLGPALPVLLFFVVSFLAMVAVDAYMMWPSTPVEETALSAEGQF